ncbi:MAG: DUF4062 domain-containing protein, partial [Planctomycetaceae bacterium]
MAAAARPEVFVSATSRDLGSCRRVVKEALLTLGCVPVEQSNFPPDARSVREMLRARLAGCPAVVHLAGVAFGAEPRERGAGEPRKSYTQLEYEIARELGKRVYVFVCEEGFPYDVHEPEDAERRALQRAHRERLQGGDALFEAVATPQELSARVHALQARVEELSRALARSRKRMALGLVAGILLALGLGVAVWKLTARAERTETQLGEVTTELQRHRSYVKAVAEAYTQQQAHLRELKLSEAELFDRAVAQVAEREGIEAAELRGTIDLFVAAVRADPAADFYDRALADFAGRDFTRAAENAGKAAEEARGRRVAAEKLAERATAEAKGARASERGALALQGQALVAAGRPGESVEAFEAALALTPRVEGPELWAALQRELGLAANDWAAVAEGPEIGKRRERALAAYRAALEVYTREALPQDWAMTQNNLAVVLSAQARASEGSERARLLGEAVAAYRAALEVYTREALPQDWAM